MRTWAKILGIAAAVSGVVSFTHFGSDFLGGGLKPLSAVLFGAAFISWVFAPEYRKYDEEQAQRPSATAQLDPQPSRASGRDPSEDFARAGAR
jgi:hypothetical protein